MRILKIELQNINSLKSNEPIIIDFESELFRDVGLYAITGPTGAGKTTILDAITIALYHNVPRFNSPSVKANLRDVVSYGAEEAMARVSFENKGLRYEAQWSMRLTSKTGKILNAPKEEVRLKNLSAGTIIGEKKTEIRTEIEQITQLNYQQFLRSAMLAQGEFAAFLSATSAEKGRLLEQITGEDIYKKIGETINTKKAIERKKLDEIRAKINSEDLLSEEIRQSLLLEQAMMTEKLNDTETEWTQVVRISNWFKKWDELLVENEKLLLRSKQLETEKQGAQWAFESLKLHQKAEPHQPLLFEIKVLEKDIASKTNRQSQLKIKLEDLRRKVKVAEKEKTGSAIEHQDAVDNYKVWLPKLDEVSKLDSTIIHQNDNQKRIKKDQQENQLAIAKLKKLGVKKTRLQKENSIHVSSLEQFLNDNKNKLSWESELGRWQSELVLRKRNYEQIDVSSVVIKEKTELQGKVQAQFDHTIEQIGQAKKQLEQSNRQLDEIMKLLAVSPLEALLADQDLLQDQKAKWKEGNRLALEVSHLMNEKERLGLLIQNLEEEEQQLSQQKNELVTSGKLAETSWLDAKKIWELESKIKDFESERKNLIEGQPCYLCGSLDHPYVIHYQAEALSESQSEMDRRDAIFKKIVGDEKKLDLKLVENKTKKESNVVQLSEISASMQKADKNFESLGLHHKITDVEGVGRQLLEIERKSSDLAHKIKEVQQWQKSKDQLESVCKKQTEQMATLNTQSVRFSEQLSALHQEIKQKQIEVESVRVEIEKMENRLSEELQIFQLNLPSVDESSSFIVNLRNEVVSYRDKEKQLAELKSLNKELSAELLTIQNQISERQVVENKYNTEHQNIEEKHRELSAARNIILPQSIAVEEKRRQLQQAEGVAKKTLDAHVSQYQLLITEQTSTHKESDNLAMEVDQSSASLNKKMEELGGCIELSAFESRLALEEALLPLEKKNRCQKTVKDIQDRMLELKTLGLRLDADREAMKGQKDFDVTAEEALQRQQYLEKERKQLQERTGEIRQKFVLDQQIKERNQQVYLEISKQELVVKKWNDLMNLLGGSKDAFNTYVQRLTLHNLIQLANVHLFKLNRRYSLRMDETYKPGEELYFKLIDHYQTDEARYVDTSSGGEKFLISLALALGLSDLASNNVSIDSLFIDEGFGTLDTQTLETVITSLETLQAHGKMIGIISHVDNLKERIPTQIRVVKKSHGVSEVELF